MQIYTPLTRSIWSALAAIGWRDGVPPGEIAIDPAIFHGASLVAHILAALALLSLLRSLGYAEWPALAGALLFGLHPVQVEPVAWASGMKDVLCGMFAAVTLWQYAVFDRSSRREGTERETVHADPPPRPPASSRKRDGSAVSRASKSSRRSSHGLGEDRSSTARSDGEPSAWWRSPWMHYAAALAACVCAMLAKPTGMVVPALVAALGLVVLRRPLRRVALELGPWFLLSLVCAVLARIVQPQSGIPLTPLWTRPLIAGEALAFYLYKLVFPLTLSVDYGMAPDVVMKSSWI